MKKSKYPSIGFAGFLGFAIWGALHFISRSPQADFLYTQDDERVSYETLVKETQPYLDRIAGERRPSSLVSSQQLKPGIVFPALTEASLMMELEKRGFRLESLLARAPEQWNNAKFATSSTLYADFVKFTREDIAASIVEENKYRVEDWGLVGNSINNKRKNLDPLWLSSPDSFYELVGVVNRMDRAVFASDTCGELRLLYRLAYKRETIASRLPFTINLVFYLPDDKAKCSTYLREWVAPDASKLGFPALADWVMSAGPLRAGNLDLKNAKALETNFQVIRSSSGVRNLLGGTGEYVLRVYHFLGDRLARASLENTIDPIALNANASLKAELLNFLRRPDSFQKLEQGILKIPEKFLTTKMSSFSPHGIARLDNRPIDKVFTEKDFLGLNYSPNGNVRSPSAALRRLNDLSCVGCHQNRTIAGFHFLGEDRPQTHPLNSIFFAGSGHFRSELVRRMKYLNALLQGREPAADRPFSIAPSGAQAKYGDFCGLPGSKAFDNWVCEDGLVCANDEGAEGEKELGKCVPKVRLAGDGCIRNFIIQNHHSLDKTVQPTEILGCNGTDTAYSCQPPGGGFPSGMCTTSCAHMQDSRREICGPIAGAGFGDCLAGRQKTFDQCLEEHKELKARGRCDDNRACRNDYVCMRVNANEGACVPSYFLFQIRVDGHPQAR